MLNPEHTLTDPLKGRGEKALHYIPESRPRNSWKRNQSVKPCMSESQQLPALGEKDEEGEVQREVCTREKRTPQHRGGGGNEEVEGREMPTQVLLATGDTAAVSTTSPLATLAKTTQGGGTVKPPFDVALVNSATSIAVKRSSVWSAAPFHSRLLSSLPGKPDTFQVPVRPQRK